MERSTDPVTGSGEVGSGPRAAKTIIWLLLGVRSGLAANNNNSLIDRERERERERAGGSGGGGVKCSALVSCVGGYERSR